MSTWNSIYGRIIDKEEFIKIQEFVKQTYLSMDKGSFYDVLDKVRITYERLGFTDFKLMWKDIRKNLSKDELLVVRSRKSNNRDWESIASKKKETCLERYGVDCSLKSIEVQKKIKATCLLKYGAENPFASDVVRKGISDRNKEKYFGALTKNQLHLKNIDIWNNKDKFISFIRDLPINKNSITNIAKLFNCSFSAVAYKRINWGLEYLIPLCTEVSDAEIEVREFINGLGVETISNCRTVLGGAEIDIFIPKLNIGIEFNGDWWHCDRVIESNYHYKKYLKSCRQGLDLISIWGSEWETKKDIVKRMLINKLKCATSSVYARDCKVCYNPEDLKQFLINNHIQGFDFCQSSVGLKHNEKLVAVMTFKKSRDNKSIELSRYATSIRVVGGFSKLLKNCGLPSGTIISSYSDNRLSNGNTYLKNGWRLIKELPSDYSISFEGRIFHKSAFRKDLIRKRFSNMDFTNEVTEWQMEDKVHALRLWDCGKKKWEYVIK